MKLQVKHKIKQPELNNQVQNIRSAAKWNIFILLFTILRRDEIRTPGAFQAELTWKRTLLPSRSSVCQRVVLMGVQGLGNRGTSWPISSTLNCSTAELQGSTRTPGDNCFKANCRHSPGSVWGGQTRQTVVEHSRTKVLCWGTFRRSTEPVVWHDLTSFSASFLFSKDNW